MKFIELIEEKICNIRKREAGNEVLKRHTYWRFYTISFIIVCFISLISYLINGTSIVWSLDGMDQFYPYFVYEGQWLREIVANFASGNFTIPMWSFDLGYGADILSEMDVFYDPLNLISGICPEEYSEWAFQFLVIFRLFLAGATFSLLSLHFNNQRWSTLLSSLVYCLSVTALTALHWPGSTWPLILFPLLILGVEKIFEGKRPYLFISASFLFFFVTWYFAYMATIFLVIYCAVRVWNILKSQNKLAIANFTRWTFRLAGFYAIGIAMSGVALFPMLTDLSLNERAQDVETIIPFLYSFTYYMDALGALIGSAGVGSDCFVGYGPVAFLACLLLLSNKEEGKLIKVALIAMIIILLIPALGSALNGFNYATNRWVWAFSLIVCFILAKQMPAMLSPRPSQVRLLLRITCVLVLVVFVVAWMRNEKTIASLVVFLIALAICIHFNQREETKRIMLSIVVVCGVVINAFYFTCAEISGTAKESPTLGSMYSKLTTNSCNWAVKEATDEQGDSDDANWRYDAEPECGDRQRNASAVLGLSGFDFYNSLYNGKIDKFHSELGLTQGGSNFLYHNLMASTMVERLMGTKYFVIPREKTQQPYGFSSTPCYSRVAGTQNYDVYKYDKSLGKAFSYNTCISKSTYDSLTPFEKQVALLQGAVVEDSQITKTGTRETTISNTSKKIEYEVCETEDANNAGSTEHNIYMQDNSIVVLKENSSITLNFEGQQNCETYINFLNFKLNPYTPFDIQNAKYRFTGKQATITDNLCNLKNLIKWVSPTTFNVVVDSDGKCAKRKIVTPTASSHLYGGKDDWTIDLGYSQTALTTITLTFSCVGEYTFDDISVVCQPMNSIDEYTDELFENKVSNYTESINCISAHVDSDETKMVFFSTPLTNGWSATVDGKPAEILQTNTAFMGIRVEAGSHDIELHFTTPGAIEGLIATTFGCIAFLSVMLFYGLKRRNEG